MSNREPKNVAEIAQLFDLYGGLLTEKKRRIISLHYEEDLSLSEMAEELAVSRAAVYDSLTSAERSLYEYERVLGLLAGQKEREAAAGTIRAVLGAWRDLAPAGTDGRVTALLDEMSTACERL